jgi:hypothetical protein
MALQVDLAFNVLDTDCSNTVELTEIMQLYDASQHPAVKDGSKTASAVLREFLDTFDAGELPRMPLHLPPA